jgi:hypothetical protein
MMKKIYTYILITAAALFFAAACTNDAITYDGPARVSFALSKASLQVKDEPNQILRIPLTTTTAFAEDTPVALVVTPGEEGTVNNTQFTAPLSVTFPAGEYSAELVITGHYDALETGVKYTFTLSLDPTVATIQGNDVVAIDLARFCPFDLSAFIGNATADDEGLADWGLPVYSVAFIEDNDADDKTLTFLGFFGCEPGDAGWPMSITFDEDGNVTIPATDVWAANVGLGIATMQRMCGDAANKDAPIVGTYNTCERTIEFSYEYIINDSGAGSYDGYHLGTYHAIITLN